MGEATIFEIGGGEIDTAIIGETASALRKGKVVVIPTETVYGLVCNSRDAAAVSRVYSIKGRSWRKPLAFYLSSAAEAARYADGIPAQAVILMERFWPGPLTVIVPVGGERVGLRCPDDGVTRALIGEAGVPLVGTSANRSGEPPPVSGDEAVRAMGGLADVILKGGRTRYCRESTIVDLCGAEPVVVREGVLASREIMIALSQGSLK